MNIKDIVITMRNRKRIIGLVAAAIAALIIVTLLNRPEPKPNTNTQPTATQTAPSEQNNEPETLPEEDIAMELDVATQQFTLVGSNVSCSTTTVNGQTSRSCAGTISIVPFTKPDHDPALYKINEQTKLLHQDQEQNIEELQQLSQNRTTVRLVLVPDSGEMLGSISY